jgi:hypothetical protein
MRGEMPGSPLPGRPGGEPDQLLLDMLFERRPVPPGAPPEMHDLARMLATLDSPAEPGELAGEAEALAAFWRLASPARGRPAAVRPIRRGRSRPPARIRAGLAAAVTALVAGVGGTAAAYAGALPDPVQEVAHVMVGAPAPHHGGPQRPAMPAPRPDTQPALRPASQPGPGQNHAGGTDKTPGQTRSPGSGHGSAKGDHGTARCCAHNPPGQNKPGADRTIQASQRRRWHAARPPRPAIGRPVAEACTAASFRLKDS